MPLGWHRLAATFADLAFDRPEDLGKDPAALAQDKKTPPALSLLLREVILQTGRSLTDDAGQNPMNSADIAHTAANGATTLRYIVDSAQAGLKDNAEAKDAASKELAKWFAVGIGVIPYDKVPVAGGVAERVLDAGIDALFATDHAAGRLPVDAKTDIVVDLLMNQQIETALANAGAWDVGETPSQWLAKQGYGDAEAARFIDDRGRILPFAKMTDEQRSAYRLFLNKNGVIAGALDAAKASRAASTANAQNDYTGYAQ